MQPSAIFPRNGRPSHVRHPDKDHEFEKPNSGSVQVERTATSIPLSATGMFGFLGTSKGFGDLGHRNCSLNF